MKQNKKLLAILVSVSLVIGLGIGSTVAFLTATHEEIENTFTPSSVTTWVDETREGNVKKNVKITNTGDTTAYIRAAVVVTWQNEAGDVWGVPVKPSDYEINMGADWELSSDGFYYYPNPVDAGSSTTDLIVSCRPVANPPETGYYMNIEIVGSGVQSVPTSVVLDVWKTGVSAVNGTTLSIRK